MGKFEDNMELFRKVVACEPVDRIPIGPCGNAYMARAQGLTIGEYIRDFDKAIAANIAEHKRIDADFTQSTLFSPYLLGTQWLCPTAIPGDGLGEDDMWQVREKEENVEWEDYDRIKEMGWDAWWHDFVEKKCNDNFHKLEPFFAAVPKSYEAFYEAGIPCICDFLMITPFEYLCGGRGLTTFFCDDIMDEPETVHEISDIILESELKRYAKMMDDTHPTAVWIGGWRTGPDLISPDMFDEFVWPSFKAYYDLCIEKNVVPMFHLDSNWTLIMDRFTQLPEKSYIVALDSQTDIRKAREILGPNVCILGDVPCEMMTFGSPEDVKKYVTSLLDDIGPWGVIIATGCDIPSDAKPENVLAMGQAAHDYLKNK